MSGHDARLLACPTPCAHPTPLPSRIPDRASPGTRRLVDVHLVIRFLLQPFHLPFHEPSATTSFSYPGPASLGRFCSRPRPSSALSNASLASHSLPDPFTFLYLSFHEENSPPRQLALRRESNGKLDDCLGHFATRTREHACIPFEQAVSRGPGNLFLMQSSRTCVSATFLAILVWAELDGRNLPRNVSDGG